MPSLFEASSSYVLGLVLKPSNFLKLSSPLRGYSLLTDAGKKFVSVQSALKIIMEISQVIRYYLK